MRWRRVLAWSHVHPWTLCWVAFASTADLVINLWQIWS